MKLGLKLPSVKLPQAWLNWLKVNKNLAWYFGGLVLVLVIGFGVYSLFFNRGITLVSMSPVGEISPKTNLTFTFSANMVPEQEVGMVFRGSLIRFNPEIPGRYRWISRRELEFLPEAPFRPSTRYQLELRPDLAKEKDKYLTGKRIREFTTYPFKVNEVGITYSYPPNQKKGIQMQARIEFNYPVAPQELQKALRLHYAGWGRRIKYNLSPNENSAMFTLASEPLPVTGKAQKVELNIPKGFRCIGGNIGLAADYTSKTTLGAKKELRILEVVAKTDSDKCWISVHCSEPVEARTVANFIQLEPEVPFKAKVNGEYILIYSDEFSPGDSYNLRLASGLPALNGFPLKGEHTAAGVFVDLEPTLKFNSKGRYLSSKGFMNLGLETVNVEKVNLEISRIYANNLVAYLNALGGGGYYDEEGYYDDNRYLSSYKIAEYGQIQESKDITIGGGKNETNTTPIRLGDFFSEKQKGIFQVVVYDNNYRWRQDSKYVIITDLGILAKMGGDELAVWVNSLETLEPKGNTKVSLISKNNQVIATETTDNNGLVRFKKLGKIAAGFQPYIILAEKDNDFSFVNLNSSLISTTDFDVRGRTGLEAGYEAFLYMDRDVFRPGDKGNLVSVIRGPKASLPGEFPVHLEIKQPDGQTFKQLQSNTGSRGVCEFGVEIPDYAQTGKYTAVLMVAEQAVGETTFSVEEFMPERIKVTAKTDRDEYNAGESATIRIEGITLFGPPAAGRRTKMRVKVEPDRFNPPGYQSYSFGDPRRTFTNIDEELGDDELDQNGLAGYSYTVPKELTPPARLRATFQATVIEEGGRAVSSYKVVTFHPYDMYIGIKPLVQEYGEVGKPYNIKYVALSPQGKPVSKPELKVEVYHITWNSVYRKDSEGRYTYVSEEERKMVYSGPLPATAGENSFQYTPKDYGQFQIVIAGTNSEVQASLDFYASGWGYSPWAMESPEKIQLDLEQKTYRVGQNARVQVKAPFTGKALVTIERGRVYDYQIVNLKKNTGVVTIPVKEDYQPNVYVSVHLIRSVKSLEKNAPVRAFGTIPLMVDCSNHNLNIQLKTPAEIRPNREIEVQVNVNNTGDRAYLTLAAVDEGICQLTNYMTPNPMDFFYGKRALAIDSYDLYSMILPEVAPIQSKGSPGGGEDEESQIRRQNLNPVSVRRVKPVSLWSGLVKLQSGAAKVKFTVPQFNGTLRLMTVVSSATNFGSAQKKILVRDPIVLTPTFPRFVAPGDRFTVPVSVFNGTGQAGRFNLRLQGEGPVELDGDPAVVVNLKKEEEQLVRFRLRAQNAVGKLSFKLTVQGNGQTCQVSEELALRPAVPLTHELLTGTITAQKPLNLSLETNWLPGTADYSITLAPFPSVKFAGSLLYLLTYPHGCVEQTTSRVMPLLYFDELAKATATDVFKGGNPDYYINQGIAKLESMQLWDGSFSYWPGGNYGYDWSSIYASHFLIEAQKAGFTVSDRVYTRMISNLIKITKSNDRDEYHLQTKVYALYALSLAGKPQTGVMSYLKNYALKNLSLYSRAQLAAGYFYTGDRNTAQSLLPVSFAAYNGGRESGGNFNSEVRSDAIILSVLADVEPNNPAVPKLVSRISKQADTIGYWGTTQENAFALLAVGKVLSHSKNGNYNGTLMVGNKKMADFSNAKTFQIHDRKLGQGPVTIRLTGGGTCYYYIKSSGVSNNPAVTEYDHGIEVRREFLDRYGNGVNLNQVKQGELLVARISISNNQGRLENLAVVDMLPAGFEIENPRLGKDASFPWTNDAVTPEYMDIRDDRIILFMNFGESGSYNFYYAVRAVTCGDFVLPPIKAECMYEPEISSYASSGKVKVEQ